MGQMTHYHSCQSLLLLNLNHVSNAQLVSMAEPYFLNFLLLDVASVFCVTSDVNSLLPNEV